MSASRSIPKRAFQAIALLTLPLPFAATWLCTPYVPRPLEATDFAMPLRLLMIVLMLLGFVLLWAAALMPLRRRSGMPTLSEEMSASGATSLGGLFDHAQRDLQDMKTAADPQRRRTYHLRMAGAGVVVACASAAATAIMLTTPSGTVFLWFPVACVVSVVMSVYHLVRGLTLPSR